MIFMRQISHHTNAIHCCLYRDWLTSIVHDCASNRPGAAAKPLNKIGAKKMSHENISPQRSVRRAIWEGFSALKFQKSKVAIREAQPPWTERFLHVLNDKEYFS